MDKGYLVGDVGGTNTRLRIVSFDGSVSLDSKYLTKELDSLQVAILDILNQSGNIEVVSACLGVAGPVEEGKYCDSHLLPWEIDTEEILRNLRDHNFNLENLLLINDFEALGWGVSYLVRRESDEDKEPPSKIVKRLNDVKEVSGGKKCLIGAGTGLGFCELEYHADRGIYVPSPSEGGHITLPTNFSNEEVEMVKFIQSKKQGKVCYKDVLSGEGLETIYCWLSNTQLPADRIVQRENDHSKKACDIFSRFYGRFASDAALMALATGGVYIAGGIAIKNPFLVESEIFKKEFNDSCDHMRKTIDGILLSLITDERVALEGALFYLKLQNG